jgi:integrase
MLGGIYTDQKCPICRSSMRDNHRDAVACPIHKREKAHTLLVRFTRKIQKRFTGPGCYEMASRYLTGLRFKHDEGSYDPRDYQSNQPLAFVTLAGKYLEMKERTLSPGTMKNLRPRMARCVAYFGHRNVKHLGYGDFEDFILEQTDLSDKTKSDVLSMLHDFYTWLARRQEIRKDQIPEFPAIRYELGWRKTVDKNTQDLILAEIHRLTWDDNPKIYLAVLWCSTYINIRPGEWRGVLEEDIDIDRGIILVRDHKTKKHTKSPKVVALIGDDAALLRSIPRSFPKLHFFRHPNGKPFGKELLYNTWKRACRNLGIEDVDLYGGTRHSSMQHLRELIGEDGVKRLSDHATNAALYRYLQVGVEEKRSGFELARKSSTKVTRIGPRPEDQSS